MVVETLWPDSAPWWLNMFIWMALFWWYILIGFVPAFYIAITKLFGMPLLQRWQNEVVIMLYPNKVKFGKITQQLEPYFRYKKGVYWMGNPLEPRTYEEMPERIGQKLLAIKERYEILATKQDKTNKEEKEVQIILKQQVHLEKKTVSINPVNHIHIFTHAVNQPIYDMERRQTKVDEILNNEAKVKKIAGHGIWIMQNPLMHFHRHFQLIVDPSNTKYKIIPVKERQQFSIGFWHSLGIIMLKSVEGKENEMEVASSAGGRQQLVETVVTTHAILQSMKEVQDYQNFSASRAYMLLKRRSKIEEQFMLWITGAINPLIFIALGGMVAVVAAIYLFMGHSPTPPTGPATGVHQIL